MLTAFGERIMDGEMEKIKHLYHTLEEGYNSMPLNLPGTLFHKAMKVCMYGYGELFDIRYPFKTIFGSS